MTETTEAAPTPGRGAALNATRKSKMDALFGEGRRYEVVKPVNVEGENRFSTPFGNKGRNGFHIRRVDGPAVDFQFPDDSGDDQRGFIVGETMLRQIADQYGAVEVPEKERKRRTKEQKAADEAAAAQAQQSE